MRKKKHAFHRFAPTALLLLAIPYVSAYDGNRSIKTPPAPTPPKSTEDFKELKKAYVRSVEPIFREKCFDCHSDRTRFPRYYRIAGVRVLIDRHMEKGRESMDMSWGFPFRGHGSSSRHLIAIIEVVENVSMPPLLYRIAHWGSGLTGEERKLIIAWAKGKLDDQKL